MLLYLCSMTRTYRDWPSQCTKICCRVKPRAIASVLTALINNFECIGEGRMRWVCINWSLSSNYFKKRIWIDHIFSFPSLSNNALVAIDRTTWPCLLWLLPLRTHSLWRLLNSHMGFKWHQVQRCRSFPSSNSLSNRRKHMHRNKENTYILTSTWRSDSTTKWTEVRWYIKMQHKDFVYFISTNHAVNMRVQCELHNMAFYNTTEFCFKY